MDRPNFFKNSFEIEGFISHIEKKLGDRVTYWPRNHEAQMLYEDFLLTIVKVLSLILILK